jgi:hypothetical protein
MKKVALSVMFVDIVSVNSQTNGRSRKNSHIQIRSEILDISDFSDFSEFF